MPQLLNTIIQRGNNCIEIKLLTCGTGASKGCLVRVIGPPTGGNDPSGNPMPPISWQAEETANKMLHFTICVNIIWLIIA